MSGVMLGVPGGGGAGSTADVLAEASKPRNEARERKRHTPAPRTERASKKSEGNSSDWLRLLRTRFHVVTPGEKAQWSAECAAECWQHSEPLSEREVHTSFLSATAVSAPAGDAQLHMAEDAPLREAEKRLRNAEVVQLSEAGDVQLSEAEEVQLSEAEYPQLSEAQSLVVRRYVQLQAPFAVFRFLAFFARQAGIWMPGAWGRAYNANLVREFDRREQHYLAEEEAIHKECLQANLRASASVPQTLDMAERVTTDDEVTVGVLAGISFVIEHCSYDMCNVFLCPSKVVDCYTAGDLGTTAAQLAQVFLDAVSELPEGASMVRGGRFTMPVATSKAQLSWEDAPIGVEFLSQAHTYAWLLEKLVSNPPNQMQQGDYLAVHSHMAHQIGPFYAQLTVCHFLLFYPSLAAPPGCEVISEGARVCGPATSAALVKLGVPSELHFAALRLMCEEWPAQVLPIWEVHKVGELQWLAEHSLLKVAFSLRAEMIP